MAGVEFAASSCPRAKLLRWVVTSRWESDVINLEPLAATILIALTVRQTHNLISIVRSSLKCEATSVLSDFHAKHEDFETLLVQCCFVPPASCEVPIPYVHHLSLNHVDSKFTLLPRVTGNLIEALQDDYDGLPPLKHTSADFLERFQRLNFRVGVYLNAINVLEKHSLWLDTGIGHRSSLEKLFDKALSQSLNAVVEFTSQERSKYTPADIIEVIQAMRCWLKPGHLTDKSKNLITQRFPLSVQDFLKRVYRSNLSRYVERKQICEFLRNSYPCPCVLLILIIACFKQNRKRALHFKRYNYVR